MNYVVTPLEAAVQTGLTASEIFEISDGNEAVVKLFDDAYRVDLFALEAVLAGHVIRQAA